MSDNEVSESSIIVNMIGLQSPRNASVTCAVCFDDVNSNNEMYIVACRDTQHPGFHKECLSQYCVSKVNEGFPGVCPSMFCPCQHTDKKRRILRFTSWKSVIASEIYSKFQTNAESLLAFLCSNCHVLRPVTVPYNEEDCAKAILAIREKFNDNAKFDAFSESIEAFAAGEYTVVEFYDKIGSDFFTEFQTGEDKEVWATFKLILQLLEDPERRANLQLRHLRARPRMWTPCCSKEHCFRCRTKDFHTGKTCEQNTKALDSSIVPCPTCGVYLTKGDGCNSVTCVCGRKFAWSEEKETINRTNSFFNEFPTDTSIYCAKILCNSIPGSETNAIAWRSRHMVDVNQAILTHWRSIYSHCPSQAIALLDPVNLSQGKKIAVDAWESKYGQEVKRARQSNEKCRNQLFLSLYRTEAERFMAAKRLFSTQASDPKDRLEGSIRLGAKAWASLHCSFYDREMDEWKQQSAVQFMLLFGSKRITDTIPGHFNLPCADSWNTSVSNSHLSFTNNNRTTKRPGSASSYPAAFANIPSPQSTICVELDEAFSGANWLTFGIARRGMENSGSDGVGLTPDTWGICDERDSAQDAVLGSCGNRIGRCRKFKKGDIVKGQVDLRAGWFDVSIVDSDFSYRFDIPKGSCDDYYFAMTFANNHQATIILDPFFNPLPNALGSSAPFQSSLKGDMVELPIIYHLNSDQTEMYFNLRSVLMDLRRPGDSSRFKFEIDFLVKWCSKWQENVRRRNTDIGGDALVAAYDRIKEFIDIMVKDDNRQPDPSTSSAIQGKSMHLIPSWEDLLGACCWFKLNQAQIEAETLHSLSFEFLIEYQDSALYMAALLLSPSMIESTPPETVQRAKAYMALNAESMNDWYDYYAVEAGLEHVPPTCRCLPRHVKACPRSK